MLSTSSPSLFLTIMLSSLVVCFAAFILAILVHELGHALAGKLVGFKVRSIEVLGFGLRVKDSGYKFSYLKKSFAGGLVTVDMPGEERLLRRFRVFVAGGPIASILFALLTLTVHLALKSGGVDTPTQYFAVLFSQHITFVAIFIAVLQLIPLTSKGFHSDALLLLRTRGSGQSETRLISLLLIANEARQSKRAKEWNKMCLEAVQYPKDGSFHQMQGHVIRYYHFADTKDYQQAWLEIDQAHTVSKVLGKQAGYLGQISAWERVFVQAWFFRNAAAARNLLPLTPAVNELVLPSKGRALAALNIVEGSLDEARRQLDEYHTVMQRVTSRLNANSETDNALAKELEDSLAELKLL